MEYLLIIFTAIFVNNIVLHRFFGICPFLGVSSKLTTAIGMSVAVTFVMTLSTLVTSLIHTFVLVPFEVQFLRTVSFILVIASLVQMVELVLKKVSPPMYKALGIYLPLITTNCAILGVAVLATQREYAVLPSVVFGFANALGFGLALIIFAAMRERFVLYGIPESMDGAPIALITAGIISLAFMGFSGMFQ